MKFNTPWGTTFLMCEKYAECYSFNARIDVCTIAEGKHEDGSTCKILENYDVWMRHYIESVIKHKKDIEYAMKENERMRTRPWRTQTSTTTT